MAASCSRAVSCFVILAFFACCWASEVQELDVTPNNLESYLKHHPKDLEENESVHDFGDGFFIRDQHVEHLAQHIGNHLKWTTTKLRKYADMMDEKKYFTKEWLDDEVDRYHREEGSASQSKERARKFLESRSHSKTMADNMWAKAGADQFYDELGTHDPKSMTENLMYDPDKDPEYHEQVKIFDDWMAKERAPGGFMTQPDEGIEQDLGPVLGDEVLLDEGDTTESNAKQWKMSLHNAAKTMGIHEAPVAAPKTGTPRHTVADANMALQLRKAGYTEHDLHAILDVVAKSTHESEHRRLGASKDSGSCTPGQCATVLQNHIVDTSAEIARLTGKPVPAAPAGGFSGYGGKGQSVPLPRGGGMPYLQVTGGKPGNTRQSTVIDPVTGRSEPRITLGSSREDLMYQNTEQPEPVSRNDIRGAMEDMDGENDIGINKPGSVQKDPPAPPYSPPPAPDELPPGCPVTEDRFKGKHCKRYDFMGPFGCWSMGQGEHSMGKEGLGADFRTILRDNDFYPASQKKGYVDLSDFRWRFTAGKCMWWNQMYRSMNEPSTLDDGNPEGSYKVFRMCMIYSMMMSRHWGAKDAGADYRIAVTKGIMQEFASKTGSKVMPESQALVDQLNHFNNDLVGRVWTVIYEFGMNPCVNYMMIFFMVVEALAGLKAPMMKTVDSKRGCLDDGVPLKACLESGTIYTTKCKPMALGGCARMLGIQMITYLPPLSFTRPAVRAFIKIVDKMEVPIEKARKFIDLFYETKASLSDPIDVFWIHAGDFIGILEIMVAIPIKPIQAIFEGLIKTLKLVPVMKIINKVLGFLIKLALDNPLSTIILKGPLKVCTLILKAFTENPIAKGLIGLMKGLMSLLDKPIKFSIFSKRFCFTVLGILKKVGKLFNAIINKVMAMVKAVLKPIFDLIDKGFKKITSLVKLPSIGILKGVMGKSQGMFAMLKSIGALDNPISLHAACAYNLPWVLESGQNLCNCCMLGYLVSTKMNTGWSWNDIQQKKLMMQKKAKCNLYKIQGACVMKDLDKKQSMMGSLLKAVCPFSKITGKFTRIGSARCSAHMGVPAKGKRKVLLNAVMIYFFKGFICRFQNIGLNPKVMMQLSPLPKLELFRRRRGGSKKSTPGMDKCKAFLSSTKTRRRRFTIRL